MKTQPNTEPNTSQTAYQLIENAANLSPAEKASLLSVIDSYEKEIDTLSAQLTQTEETAKEAAVLVKNWETELEQKNWDIAVGAALEKIRSRSLAINSEEELHEVVRLVFQKLEGLGISMQGRWVYIILFGEQTKELIEWVALPEHAASLRVAIPFFNHPVLTTVWDAKSRGEKYIATSFSPDEKASYFDYYLEHVHDHPIEPIKHFVSNSPHYSYFMALEKVSAIGISSFNNKVLSEKEAELLKHIARIFEQAYSRFLDMQKINSQAKAAWVEAALEKVRSRTMAMQNSHDVGDAIGLLFTELEKLGIVTLRCGIFIIEEGTKMLDVWTASTTNEGKVGRAGGRFSMTIHPMLLEAYEAWKNNEAMYTYELAGEELTNYFKILLANNPNYYLPAQNLKVDRQFSSGYFFKEGALFTFTTEPHSAENNELLKRFAAVFGLTYRRYLDLKRTEEQNQQLVKQASIDRLRAEIASMRTTDDLHRITPLVWRELTTLKVPFVRCGVFIIAKEEGFVHAYLSTPEGKPRGVVHMPIDEKEHIRKLVDHWQEASVYIDHWDKEQFLGWMAYLNTLKPNSDTTDYLIQTNVPENLHLHFIPFTQGMLYVGNASSLTPEEIQMAGALADAFSIAYARYEDFRQLEDAKNRVEVTLHELKSTQRQLIQSERLASLGELTAGIAHEIQNPLNFVNNFSETTVELFKELEETLQYSEGSEAASLVEEIRQSLQKISHHGKRADSIVKNMLQHSRKNNEQKILTDVNALVDEYLRLSYHGFRAKDLSFSVQLQTRFDEKIGKKEIFVQDIGRVLLNLLNNAFYAVKERKKREGSHYEPAIQVTTSFTNGQLAISVKDNGMGISATAMAKIFQPFFTTKPTGEGTGLGLSLSYDIIKANGGELKVDSREGEGTEFVMILPA